jgi:hypothetical protein
MHNSVAAAHQSKRYSITRATHSHLALTATGEERIHGEVFVQIAIAVVILPVTELLVLLIIREVITDGEGLIRGALHHAVWALIRVAPVTGLAEGDSTRRPGLVIIESVVDTADAVVVETVAELGRGLIEVSAWHGGAQGLTPITVGLSPGTGPFAARLRRDALVRVSVAVVIDPVAGLIGGGVVDVALQGGAAHR